ncbi:hypothetical protein V0288_03615 [Pannus brasiliensis CCIBt3594]|uniref:Uncharacterized protein n=1 Tax=Pannus brasiliensis CCIBt3594 TaxID=1427578 RepID=A0AAW9QN83_9CHRO
MKNNFWGLIWSSFSVIQTLWLGLLGFVASILAWAYAGQTPIPLVVVFVIITVAVLAIATLIRALRTAFEEYQKVKQSVIPNILRVQKDGNNNIVCLLESSNSFSIELLISFYYTDEDGFERLIGEGFVEYINPNDGRIQAVIDKPQITYQAILDRLASNDVKVIQETRVRPGVLRKHSPP